MMGAATGVRSFRDRLKWIERAPPLAGTLAFGTVHGVRLQLRYQQRPAGQAPAPQQASPVQAGQSSRRNSL
jgi:hypothetical protein